jgi:hypothetical protein
MAKCHFRRTNPPSKLAWPRPSQEPSSPDNFRLPLVLAGGLGGTSQTGRTLNYLRDSEDNRKMCSLYLSLMDRYGVKLEQFGDSQTRLERL